MDATHLKSTVYYQDPSSGHWYNEVDVRFDGTDTTGWRCIDASKQKPLERPEYVRCISHNRVGSYQSTWCGRINQPGDSAFLNLTHAANNGLSPAGRLVACKECAEAAYTALAHGHPYDSRAPDLPTTSAPREGGGIPHQLMLWKTRGLNASDVPATARVVESLATT